MRYDIVQYSTIITKTQYNVILYYEYIQKRAQNVKTAVILIQRLTWKNVIDFFINAGDMAVMWCNEKPDMSATATNPRVCAWTFCADKAFGSLRGFISCS